MPRRLVALCLALALTPAHADEGMWMPSQLPELGERLRAVGFEGEPARLAQLDAPPMSAVVKVGGATGAFVSPEGLVLTNHHVAYGVIQYNSRPERDLLAQGYIAAGRADELPANPDFRVRVTTGYDRITDRILARARGQRGRAYYEAIDAAGKEAVAECEREPGMRCSVADMYYGTDFYLIRQLELRDIRLVYAPPESIGSYGDEIDNFMWPRHSGDFTFLRAYVGPDGRPADYAEQNVPYRPPAHLQVSTTPFGAGDFAMLAGYPGITFRHRTAAEFARQVEWQLPARVDLFRSLLAAVRTAVADDADARVRYASQVAGFENSLKRAEGELTGLRRSDAVAVRAADEAAMLRWLHGQPGAGAARRDIAQLGRVLDAIAATRERDQVLDAIRRYTQVLSSALSLHRLAIERTKPDAARESGYQQRDEALIAARLRQVQRRYAPEVEKALLVELLSRHAALPADQRLPELEAVFGRTAEERRARLDALYARTRLGEDSERLAWLQRDAAALAASDDPLLQAAGQLVPALIRLEQEAREHEGELLRLRPAYMRSLVGFRRSKGQAVYPDANGTLRVSYGRVSPLVPRDAVTYAPVTTVAGILEKHTGQAPFDAPAPLREAIRRGDFGSTADPELGTQSVNFLTNLDTTGGNSGSPVLDAQGRLIGLNFDSNWEAVSASWMFDPRYKRAVHVDLRYLRWLMAKVYPAPHLLTELGLPTH